MKVEDVKLVVLAILKLYHHKRMGIVSNQDFKNEKLNAIGFYNDKE